MNLCSLMSWMFTFCKGEIIAKILCKNVFSLERNASIIILQILKPAFTVLVDQNSKTFLLLIRGTHSMKDTLTAATGAVVPFHHSVVHEGGVSNLVLGYAHCGMVAAARWIAKLATPCLIKALYNYPDYKLKVFDIWSFICPISCCSIIWVFIFFG